MSTTNFTIPTTAKDLSAEKLREYINITTTYWTDYNSLTDIELKTLQKSEKLLVSTRQECIEQLARSQKQSLQGPIATQSKLRPIPSELMGHPTLADEIRNIAIIDFTMNQIIAASLAEHKTIVGLIKRSKLTNAALFVEVANARLAIDTLARRAWSAEEMEAKVDLVLDVEKKMNLLSRSLRVMAHNLAYFKDLRTEITESARNELEALYRKYPVLRPQPSKFKKNKQTEK